jgi:DNA-binding GntR family transcriptional regulator
LQHLGAPIIDDSSTEQSATQRAYVALRRMIVVGEISPEQKLKIEDLRKTLDLGASPIREALSLLVSDQLVVRRDQRGFKAASIGRKNFDEILQLRCSLEVMALRLSIENTNSEWEENLILSHHRMVREDHANLEASEERHKAFHMDLLANCQSPLLLGYCHQLYDLNIRYRHLAGRMSNYVKRDVAKEHKTILDAVIDGNADLACENLLYHYRQTGAVLSKLFPDLGL